MPIKIKQTDFLNFSLNLNSIRKNYQLLDVVRIVTIPNL